VITIVVLFGITFVGGIVFFVWKLNLQKNLINHLTGIAFRDVDNAVNATNTNNSNNVIPIASTIPSST